MKYIIKIMSLLLLTSSLISCENEEVLISDFNGKEPFPIIEPGTTEASQLAYDLYKDYDLHTYINLEGEEALKTEYGSINFTSFPLVKAEEERAVVVLKLIHEMYDLFSDYRELAVYRRLILVGNDFLSTTTRNYDKYGFNRDFNTYNIQGTQIVSNINNTFDFNLLLTKEMLLYTYFSGYFQYHFQLPEAFINVSAGNYRFERSRAGEPALFSSAQYDEELATDIGFVHPYGTLAILFNPYTDWTSYVVWIISRPKSERDEWLTTKPNIKAKYDIVIETMQDEFGMDLEAFSTAWQSVGL
ncbi:hypothetical protein MWU59_01725 [Flavobacteriaceae bacterium F08102]|nr:hypothetical protein [Flavobacteriaceae bacterium F08102]